jgi:23S rRNA A2030 N6-methylase RlmJ
MLSGGRSEISAGWNSLRARLPRPASLPRGQLLVDDPGQGEHALRMVRRGLQRPVDRVRDTAAVVCFRETRRRFGVVAFEYRREFGKRLVPARYDVFGCGHGRAPFVAWVFS